MVWFVRSKQDSKESYLSGFLKYNLPGLGIESVFTIFFVFWDDQWMLASVCPFLCFPTLGSKVYMKHECRDLKAFPNGRSWSGADGDIDMSIRVRLGCFLCASRPPLSLGWAWGTEMWLQSHCYHKGQSAWILPWTRSSIIHPQWNLRLSFEILK